MKTYRAQQKINAPPQTVWEILLDGDRYAEWDPGMIRVVGKMALGEKVKFFTKFSPEQAFAVKVTHFEPNRKLVFTGGLPFGLFTSERTHLLNKTGNGQTEFHTEEIFSGLLLPLFGRQIPDLTESFEAFVKGLKSRAESS
ncbi:MAG: SRPBCC domain-containing protein [Chloroflexota bacterium]